MNLRIDANGQPIRQGDQVHIGGNEAYVATCRKHFWAGRAARYQPDSTVITEPVGS